MTQAYHQNDPAPEAPTEAANAWDWVFALFVAGVFGWMIVQAVPVLFDAAIGCHGYVGVEYYACMGGE